MKYIGDEERIVPQYGVFKPGDVVDYDESLHSTGLFSVNKQPQKKDGEE
jgi:hypothetical protein